MLIQSLISSLDSCSVIQRPLNRNSKREDQWYDKRSPDSRSLYKPDNWPGITTTMKGSTVANVFHTDHESPESLRIDKCLDSAGFVENCKIFNPLRDALRFRYGKGKKQLRIFAGFASLCWIRPESPRYCAEFTTMCNKIYVNAEIS